MIVEAIIAVVLVFFLIDFLISPHRTPSKVRQTRQRARKLARHPSVVVDGLLIDMDRDEISSSRDDGGPTYGPTYLVYQYAPENRTGDPIEGRHYLTSEQAAEPEVAMRVGRSIRVRHAIHDFEMSVLEDFSD